MRDNSFDSLSTAIKTLESLGFTYSFDVTDGGLECKSLNKVYKPGDLKIVGKQRFEGPSSTDDSSVLYAIEAKDGAKGLIVDAYGVYAGGDKSKFLDTIEIDTGEN